MLEVECLTKDGYAIEYAYSCEEFSKALINRDINLNVSAIKGKNNGVEYIAVPITFDIETSTIVDIAKTQKDGKKRYLAYMYHFQFCVEGHVIFGRTNEEFVNFIKLLEKAYGLQKDRKVVIYCHNLSYEFQFIHDFLKVQEVFATKARKVIKFKANDFLEFRCSYMLSNMNLQKFIENSENTKHLKGVDDLDYEKTYTPKHIFTARENGYFFNDVLGLYEALLSRLKSDNIITIPLTSTGYVRRICRKKMTKNKSNRRLFLKTRLTAPQYYRLKEAIRGGNTGANRYRTGLIQEGVYSEDITSSYPFVMVTEKFPIGSFMECGEATIEEATALNKSYATLGKYTFSEVQVKDSTPIPYLPYDKCIKISKGHTNCNGRILKADYVEIYMTDVDFEIFNRQYEYTFAYVNDLMIARRGYLPKEIREEIMSLFYKKTTLKREDDMKYEYLKLKELLNSIYGMMMTDIVRDEIEFNDNIWETTSYKYDANNSDISRVYDEDNDMYKKKVTGAKEIQEKLDGYYSSYMNFLPYQWGAWVTAYARRNLQEAIDLIGLDLVYSDTDSVKHVGDYTEQLQAINDRIIKKADSYDVKPYININGNKYYLGVWDFESFKDSSGKLHRAYDRFKTLGSKKYAYEIGGDCYITVSGVNKKKGGERLKEKGGLEFFKIGEVFKDCGRTTVYYNTEKPRYIIVQGEKILVASNIAIVSAPYTLGMSDTMASILLDLGVDFE